MKCMPLSFSQKLKKKSCKLSRFFVAAFLVILYAVINVVAFAIAKLSSQSFSSVSDFDLVLLFFFADWLHQLPLLKLQ